MDLDLSTTLIDMTPTPQYPKLRECNPASLEVVTGRKATIIDPPSGVDVAILASAKLPTQTKGCSPVAELYGRAQPDSREIVQSYLTAEKEDCQAADEINMPFTPTSLYPIADSEGNSQSNGTAFKETVSDTALSPDVQMILTAPSSSTRRPYVGGQVMPSSDRAGAINSLEASRWVSATAIELVVASLPLQNIRAFDAAFIDMQDPISVRKKAIPRTKSSDKLCFIPLYLDSHYTLLIIDLRSWVVRFYDSLRLPDHKRRARLGAQNLKALIAGSDSADPPDCFQVQDFITQSNDYDCGICMLVSLIDGLLYPLDKSTLDLDLWRLAFRALIGDFSGGPDDTSTPIVVPSMLLSPVPEVQYEETIEELQSVKTFFKQLASRAQRVHQINFQIARRLKCLRTILSAAQHILSLLREAQQSHAKRVKYLDANLKDFEATAAEYDDLHIEYPAFAKSKQDTITKMKDVLCIELSKAKSVADSVERWSRVMVVCKNLERRYEADLAASSKELEELKGLVEEAHRLMVEGIESMQRLRGLFDASDTRV